MPPRVLGSTAPLMLQHLWRDEQYNISNSILAGKTIESNRDISRRIRNQSNQGEQVATLGSKSLPLKILAKNGMAAVAYTASLLRGPPIFGRASNRCRGRCISPLIGTLFFFTHTLLGGMDKRLNDFPMI